jgi:transposase
MSDTFKSFAKAIFPKASLVADNFHALRLLTPAIHRYRKAIAADGRSLPVRKFQWAKTCKRQPNK